MLVLLMCIIVIVNIEKKKKEKKGQERKITIKRNKQSDIFSCKMREEVDTKCYQWWKQIINVVKYST